MSQRVSNDALSSSKQVLVDALRLLEQRLEKSVKDELAEFTPRYRTLWHMEQSAKSQGSQKLIEVNVPEKISKPFKEYLEEFNISYHKEGDQFHVFEKDKQGTDMILDILKVKEFGVKSVDLELLVALSEGRNFLILDKLNKEEFDAFVKEAEKRDFLYYPEQNKKDNTYSITTFEDFSSTLNEIKKEVYLKTYVNETVKERIKKSFENPTIVRESFFKSTESKSEYAFDIEDFKGTYYVFEKGSPDEREELDISEIIEEDFFEDHFNMYYNERSAYEAPLIIENESYLKLRRDTRESLDNLIQKAKEEHGKEKPLTKNKEVKIQGVNIEK